MKKLIFALFILILWSNGMGQTKPNVEDNWENRIEIEQATLHRHALNDLPGSVAVLIPENGKFIVRIVGRKVLLDNNKLPKLESKPTILNSSHSTKSQAMEIGFLSFVSASMNNTDVVKFNVTETCYSLIYDKEIDWQNFEQRVQEIKKKNPNLPTDTQFGVVRIADIISIYYEIYKRIDKASKISGWGFNLGGNVLTEKRNIAQTFKIGVALIYPDIVLNNLQLSRYTGDLQLKTYSLWNTEQLQNPYKNKILNIYFAQSLLEPGSFVDDPEDIIDIY